MSVNGKRRLPFWIEAFEAYTDGSSSPDIFRKWSAIAAVAGALERKVWVKTLGRVLYPNLYTCLVAPPGVGKTLALSNTERLWRDLKDHHVAPTSLTKASLIDAINDASRKIIRPTEIPPYIEFNSLLVLAGELGVLLPIYDNDFMNVLTAIYDCYPYAERRRSKDLKITIPSPQLNLFAATTPSYLNALLPEGAWDQGFISRMILVYSGERILSPLFAEDSRDEAMYSALKTDLEIIGELYGQLSFDPDAAERISNWHTMGGPPVPEHPKLAHYVTRRTAHALKLSMVAATCRNNFNYDITLADVETALAWLLEAEAAMPDIFRSMNSGGDSAAIEDTWYMVWQTFSKEKKPVSHARIVAHLRARVPSHSVDKIIDIMVKSEMLKLELTSGGQVYRPAPKLR